MRQQHPKRRPGPGRLPSRHDDRGSMALALMAVVVGMMLAGLMLPMVIAQGRSSRFDISRVHALHAAQAGVDAMLGQIRQSTTTDSNGNVWGNSIGLPCWTQANPFSGTVDGVSSEQYSVYLSYYASNPTLTPAPSPMLCAAGYGTWDPTLQTSTPRYAIIHSTGTDGAATTGTSKGRTVASTYVFQTDDANIPGGQIRIYPDGSGNLWCLDAGSATPAAGTQLLLRACSTASPPSAQQTFAYRGDLSIQLVSSVSTAQPSGLCVDTSPTTHASTGVKIVLNPCAVANPAQCKVITACSPWNQQWSVDDNAHLRGALTDQSNTDSYCINAPSQSDGAAITLATCAGGITDTYQTWIPSPTAGAGMAGAANNQIVNYRQFATCLDVTGQNINSSFLILYTCKQNPNPNNVLWNQKFAPSPALGSAPATVLLKTTTGGVTYCLTSPLTSGGYPRMTTPCPASAVGKTAYSWTVYQTQDANGLDLPYAMKYTIVDANGQCLALGQNSDLYTGQYLKAVMAPCDGTTSQKWNANASLDAARIVNTHETQQ